MSTGRNSNHNFKAQQFAKVAQFFGGDTSPATTLADLYNHIRLDAGLPVDAKAQLINQVKGLTGYADDGTSLAALMHKGLGGAIGWLISKYFGMGALGQLTAALGGYGIASILNDHFNRVPDPLQGSGFRTMR